MEKVKPQEFLFKRDRTFDDLKSAYGEEDAMCHDSGLSWDRVFDYMSDYAEVKTDESAKELQKQCNVSMDLLAQNQKLLEALKNLENDDGCIPPHAWKMVQEAIKSSTE